MDNIFKLGPEPSSSGTELASAQRTLIASPGPGNGCRRTIPSGRPSLRPSLRTSSCGGSFSINILLQFSYFFYSSLWPSSTFIILSSYSVKNLMLVFTPEMPCDCCWTLAACASQADCEDLN